MTASKIRLLIVVRVLEFVHCACLKITRRCIYSRRDREERKVLLNKVNLALAKAGKVGQAGTGKVWLKKDGKMNEAIFTDGLSPGPAAYKALEKLLER